MYSNGTGACLCVCVCVQICSWRDVSISPHKNGGVVSGIGRCLRMIISISWDMYVYVCSCQSSIFVLGVHISPESFYKTTYSRDDIVFVNIYKAHIYKYTLYVYSSLCQNWWLYLIYTVHFVCVNVHYITITSIIIVCTLHHILRVFILVVMMCLVWYSSGMCCGQHVIRNGCQKRMRGACACGGWGRLLENVAPVAPLSCV